MKRIDRDTVNRILDAADVVDVVSDFVSLKRRGANYMGLCPFHNERTPSFSVSRAKGIYKCFSCGKAGSAVNFVMEHEQMTYNEALRYLAKKYNIEIHEHDMTDEERQRESLRESLFAANDMAMKLFEENLSDTDEGRDIGLAYFRQRGISDTAIRRFHLGYALDNPTAFLDKARRMGYNDDHLVETGLVIRRDDGKMYDRFRGRVIYPVHTISGKVVAFGGRTLRSDKKMAKYVNSPESSIYSKSRELYGLYQAKRSIVEKHKCILVEGYMDVISMSQSGVENVVASSGTSLTEGQIRLIHRFTDNVTVIYDSDAAGIKASLRGIDMLLAEGLNVKVVLLPEGDDPDSFAQSHSSSELEAYIAEHETDFIRFKTDILLADAKADPLRRAEVITDVVRSISMIPNEITRAVYIRECSNQMEIGESVLLGEMKKAITARNLHDAEKRHRDSAIASIADIETQPDTSITTANATATAAATPRQASASILPYEQEIVKLIVRYGTVSLPLIGEDGNIESSVTVLDYLTSELQSHRIEISDPTFAAIITYAREIISQYWEQELQAATERSLQQRTDEWNRGHDNIAATAINLDNIKTAEKELAERIDAAHFARMAEFSRRFLARHLMSAPDDAIRNTSSRLAASRYSLSKVHSKYVHVETEEERLIDLLPRAVIALKNAHLMLHRAELLQQLRDLASQPDSDTADVTTLMQQLRENDLQRARLAKILGERVVNPR